MALPKNISSIGKKLTSSNGAKFLSLGTAMNIGFGYMDYKQAREEGHGVIGSAGRAVASYATAEVVGIPGMLAFGALKAAPVAITKGIEGISKLERSMTKQNRRIPFANSNFVDNQQAYTMRQAGMQLAANSQYNLQQALLGNEASNLR